jgi:deazaflavin-dependent oxidoreductase (nitroreductase family)
MITGFKRWLYAGGRPNRLTRLLNGAWARLSGSGIYPNWLVALEVRGRRSGRLITLPLVMAVVDGGRYLVSMLGDDAEWVRNVRAAGGNAVVRHGRRERVRLEEIPIDERAPIIKAYLQVAPGARPHIAVDKDAALAEFESIAATIPVFRVVTGT